MKRILLLSALMLSFVSSACTEEDVEKKLVASIVARHDEVRDIKMGMFQDGIQNVYKVVATYSSTDTMPNGVVFNMEMGVSAKVSVATCEIVDQSGSSLSPVQL